MVEDSTMACQYYSGSGSNQLVFRGTAQTGDAAYLGFNSAGVGDTDVITGIIFNGSAALDDEDGGSAIGIRKEAGTAAAGTAGDKIIANASAGTVMTVNGALSGSTTLVIDGVSGATLAVGQVVTVKDVDTLAISDAAGATGLSTDNSLTITAVASQTSVTVSEAITVANDVVLLASTNGGGEILADALSFVVAGPTFASRSDISLITRTGMDTSVAVQLEAGTPSSDNGNGRLGIDASDGSASNVDSPIVVEAYLNDVSTYSASGSSSGTAYVLKGVDVSA